MKNKKFVIIIGWCPDNIDAEDIQFILEQEIGTDVVNVVKRSQVFSRRNKYA